MTQIASIKLISPEYEKLQKVSEEIKDIAKRTGAKVKGPIPLPTKKMLLPTMKSPCGDGSVTWEKWMVKAKLLGKGMR